MSEDFADYLSYVNIDPKTNILTINGKYSGQLPTKFIDKQVFAKIYEICADNNIDYIAEDTVQNRAIEAIKDYHRALIGSWAKPQQTVQVTADPIPFKEIGVKYANKQIALMGRVMALSEREPDTEAVIYLCDNDFVENPPAKNGAPPKKCVKCGHDEFTLQFDPTKAQDTQVVKLSDSTVAISCIAKGDDMMYRVRPGRKANAFGLLKYEPYFDSKMRKPKFRRFVELSGLEPLENNDVVLSEQDIQRIKEMAEEPQFYEKMRDSFAPHLYGLEEVKEACVLTLGSQGIERPLNVGLFGDPDTGKSECMQTAVEISHNGHVVDMSEATHVGLTVESAWDEDTKTRLASPGLLNFADGGLAGIDEFQNIKTEDAGKLNRVLESKEINSHKAGVHENLPARAAVIITSNSEFGRWDAGQNIYQNLKFLGRFTAALVSRFDLIYIIKDRKDKDTDTKKADKIIQTYGKAEKPKQLFIEDTEDYYGFNTMRKYFAYISQQPLPEVPDTLNEEFCKVYLNAREGDFNNMVGNRYFKSIIRLARIIARLLQKPNVTVEDLQRAKSLIDKSRDAAAFDPKTQELDPNLVNGAKANSQIKREQNQEEQFLAAFESAVKDTEDGQVKEDDIVAYMVIGHKWDEDKARRFVHKRLMNANAIPLFLENAGKWRKA